MTPETITAIEQVAALATALLAGTVPEAAIAPSIVAIITAGQQALAAHPQTEAIDEGNIQPIETLPEPPK